MCTDTPQIVLPQGPHVTTSTLIHAIEAAGVELWKHGNAHDTGPHWDDIARELTWISWRFPAHLHPPALQLVRELWDIAYARSRSHRHVNHT